MYPNKLSFAQQLQPKLCRDLSGKLSCYARVYSHRNTHCSPVDFSWPRDRLFRLSKKFLSASQESPAGALAMPCWQILCRSTGSRRIQSLPDSKTEEEQFWAAAAWPLTFWSLLPITAQSTFHGQASDRAWSFPNYSFRASRRKKRKSKRTAKRITISLRRPMRAGRPNIRRYYQRHDIRSTLKSMFDHCGTKSNASVDSDIRLPAR